MTVRPTPEPGEPTTRDGTQYIDTVERANNRQISPRQQLPDNERRLTFQRVFTPRPSAIPHTTDRLLPSDGDEPLYFVEGPEDAETEPPGELMPYQPPAAHNIIPESVNTSVNVPATLYFAINDNVFASVEIEPYGWKRAQIATLAELGEFADLDGTNDLKYFVTNRGREPLEGSISIRAIEVDLS